MPQSQVPSGDRPPPPASSLSFRGCCLFSPQGTLDLGCVLRPLWFRLPPQNPSYHPLPGSTPGPASTFFTQPPNIFRSPQQEDASASGSWVAPQGLTKTPHLSSPSRPCPVFPHGGPATLPHTPPPRFPTHPVPYSCCCLSLLENQALVFSSGQIPRPRHHSDC